MRTQPTFDADQHSYTLDGVGLPNVTQILKAVLPVSYFGATEWHMERGHAVHACAAMECQGVAYTYDPQIDGQVKAVRAWLTMRSPNVVSVERMVWRTHYIPYAGTLDLLCEINGRLWLVDWKGSASPWDQWQLGGYAEALAEDGIEVKQGMVVELTGGGQPRESKPVELRKARNEWKSILNVYAMMKREKMG